MRARSDSSRDVNTARIQRAGQPGAIRGLASGDADVAPVGRPAVSEVDDQLEVRVGHRQGGACDELHGCATDARDSDQMGRLVDALPLADHERDPGQVDLRDDRLPVVRPIDPASPVTPVSSYTVTGSDTPFTATWIPAPTVTTRRTRATVASDRRIWGPIVSDSMRPVRFTVGPTTPYFIRSWLPMLPATTAPECTAIPITSGGSPCAALSALKPDIPRCIAQAQRTARSASSGRSNGARTGRGWRRR